MIEVEISAVFAVLLFVCGCVLVYHRGLKRRLRKTLANREPVSPLRFGARHYADPRKAEIGSFILAKFQELTGYDLAGVVPSDRLVADLHLDELDSLALTEILTEVEGQFAIRIDDEEAAGIRTIGDFVEIVASKSQRTALSSRKA